MPAGFSSRDNRGILGQMRITLIVLALFLAGCCHYRTHALLPPSTPAPLEDSRPSLEPVVRKLPDTSASRDSEPPVPTEPALAVTSIDELLLRLTDAYFDLDRGALRDDSRIALRSDAPILQEMDTSVVIEGHCDERGSAEYNLALGAARAEAAKQFLITLGIPGAMLETITYGKERPQCTLQNEECWQKNRRAHFAADVRK
jgi:peptidoglycan-associated lipoprotein